MSWLRATSPVTREIAVLLLRGDCLEPLVLYGVTGVDEELGRASVIVTEPAGPLPTDRCTCCGELRHAALAADGTLLEVLVAGRFQLAPVDLAERYTHVSFDLSHRWVSRDGRVVVPAAHSPRFEFAEDDDGA